MRQADEVSRSVVIIDDEKSYVESMANLIAQHLDCPVYSFVRASDALNQLDRISAGVVVTDYLMPEMDGLEFIRRASEIAPTAAFIVISGHDLDPIEEELAGLKALRSRLQKPIGWRPLTAAILQAWPGGGAPAARR